MDDIDKILADLRRRVGRHLASDPDWWGHIRLEIEAHGGRLKLAAVEMREETSPTRIAQPRATA